ncbi:MFS transporter [Phenylobacterium montanum]|uniref:MFS transporter n=1 Tax=Phenylobacterium montanum TaxID=2823693 RepID=A0A975IX31_9CAUL|nr:MFS transporter [Caulobacter sp. S6]QUD90209.1 MFS transporter [Caulobacter sp. S6]
MSKLHDVAAQPSSAKTLALVAVSGLCMAFGVAAFFIGTFPLFLRPVSQELGWGAATFPQALVVCGLSGALAGPAIGALIDKVGVRTVLVWGMACWGAALFSMSFLTHSIVQLYLISMVLGVASSACGPVALTKLVSEHVQRARGVALGFVMSIGPAIGTAAAVTAAHWLLGVMEWRKAYGVLGGTIVLLVAPLAVSLAVLLPGRSKAAGAATAALGPSVEGGYTSGQALRSREFWIVVGFAVLVCGAINSFVGHFVAWCAERGLGEGVATMALSAFSLAGATGPLLAGALADRVADPRLLSVFLLLPVAGFCLALFGPPDMIIPALVLLGVGFSAITGLTPFLTTRYFGLGHSGQIFGLILGLCTLAMGLGPVVLGVARDAFGSYRPALPSLVVATAAAVLIGLALPRYRFAQSARPDALRPRPTPAGNAHK